MPPTCSSYHQTTHHAAHPHTCISTLVPEGVLYTIGRSVLSSVSGLHPIHTMCTVPNHKVPAYAHWPKRPPLVWLVHSLCAHHTNFPKFQLLGTCVDLHRPAFLPTWPFTACAPPCAPFHAPLHTSVHLRTVNGIKWVLHPDTICNKAQPARH